MTIGNPISWILQRISEEINLVKIEATVYVCYAKCKTSVLELRACKQSSTQLPFSPNIYWKYIIIVWECMISASIAARALKFWLQVAFGPPVSTRCAEIRKSGSGSGKSGFSGIFFRFFSASMDLLGPQGHHLDGPESPNPDPGREIRFFEIPDCSIFRLFKLKDPTIWVSMDSSGPY